MCVPYASDEKAAAMFVAEWKRAVSLSSAQYLLYIYQKRGFLKDYDPITCERKPEPKPARKPPVHKEGMKVVREALREAKKLPVHTPTREKEVSRA